MFSGIIIFAKIVQASATQIYLQVAQRAQPIIAFLLQRCVKNYPPPGTSWFFLLFWRFFSISFRSYTFIVPAFVANAGTNTVKNTI